MDEQRSHDQVEPAPLLGEAERREFLKRASQFAVGAPAAVLLLEAASRPAHASPYGTVTPTEPVTTTKEETGPSDRRLKADVVREGTLPNGLGLYSYRYFWHQTRFVGVMADEVEAIMPGAVSVHASGYKMVNYARLFG
jgi:hypothetical protein